MTDTPAEAAGEVLASRVTELMRALEVPNGLEAVGYTEADIPALVEGTLPLSILLIYSAGRSLPPGFAHGKGVERTENVR